MKKIKALILSFLVFLFFNLFVYGQSNKEARLIEKFIRAGDFTDIVIKDDEKIDLEKFKFDLIKVEKNQLNVSYSHDTVNCETFVYYNISQQVKKSFVVDYWCNDELDFVFLNSKNTRKGSIKYDSTLIIKFLSYYHTGKQNQILIHYSADNISWYYCVLEFYDNKPGMSIIFDKRGVVKY